MRTVRCSSRRMGGLPAQGVSAQGGVCPEGCVYPSMHWEWGVSAPVYAGIHHLPVDRILDTRLWKHYLSVTTLRTVKITPVLKNLKIIKYITGKIIGQQTKLFEFNQRDVFPVRDFALSESRQVWCFRIKHLVCPHTRGSSTCQGRAFSMWTGWQVMDSQRRDCNSNRHVDGF